MDFGNSNFAHCEASAVLMHAFPEKINLLDETANILVNRLLKTQLTRLTHNGYVMVVKINKAELWNNMCSQMSSRDWEHCRPLSKLY